MLVKQILRMKINMKEKAKKLFYKLLKNGKIVDAYFKHITLFLFIKQFTDGKGVCYLFCGSG